MARATLGVIVGNRDFFPDRLITEGREDVIRLFREMDIEPVLLGENDTKLGAVETWQHAKRCAELFRANADRIEGILVTLPNFGDEKGVADTIKLSRLNVPILVQAYPDDPSGMTVERRRDAFCGKISVCSNLRQYGFPFSLTSLHTVGPNDDSFKADLARFVGVCKVVNGLRTARIGAIGARPNAFNTVRYSEKLLQEAGISVSTIDLSEILGDAERLSDGDSRVGGKMQSIREYADSSNVPEAALRSMAKLFVVCEEWVQANDLNATAIQCWTSIQKNFGVNACTMMSMMSQNLMPSACEVDVTGVVSMYALQLASNSPSALVDWNNNYADDPDKCVLFHCGNWPKALLPDIRIAKADILETTMGEGTTYGAVSGRTPAGPATFARISTDDQIGLIQGYVAEGEFTDDRLETFGAKAVVRVPDLQDLMHHVCENGFEHHVAVNASHVGEILAEAFETYLGWDVYQHS